jgi:hypothetical protein
LVKRRDGTVPNCRWFVLLDRDPTAPAGLRAIADEAEKRNFDPQYVADLRAEADAWERDLAGGLYPPGDPDAPGHRQDDPATIAEMRKGRGC